MKCWTLYCHIHIETGRRYVGLTSQTMMQRWKIHISKAKSSKGGRWHFPNAIRKYGPDAFSHEVLEFCHSLEVANLAEECWIEFYDTMNSEKGFNVLKGGTHIPVDEDNIDFKIRHKAACNTPEVCSINRSTALKQHEDPDNRYRLRTLRPNPVATSEMRRKIGEANKSRIVSQGTRDKLSRSCYVRNLSPEERARSVASHRLLPKKTHCKHGHSLVDAYVRNNGERMCRVCVKARDLRRRQSKTLIISSSIE